jgi:hypothetical protein
MADRKNPPSDPSGLNLSAECAAETLEGIIMRFSKGHAYTTFDDPLGVYGQDADASGQIVSDLGLDNSDLQKDAIQINQSDFANIDPATTTYTYTTIVPPGSGYTIASSINDKGQIVGLYQDGNGEHYGPSRGAIRGT